MDRVFESNAGATPPDVPAAPSNGYPIGGNPGAAIPATKPGPYWFYQVTEELRAAIVLAGIAPSHTVLTQLRDAIRRLAGAQSTAIDATRAVTIADSGLVLINAAAGNVTLTLPAATVLAGLPFHFVRTDTSANTVTIQRAGGDTIDGVTSMVLTDTTPLSLASDGVSAWRSKAPSPKQIDKRAAALDIPSVIASVAANALTVTLKAAPITFRKTTLTDGSTVTREMSADVSLTVPSGATLGTTNGVAARLAILAIDNAGTIEPAIVNLAGGLNLDETGVVTTTALSAGSNSANVVYSTTARAGVAYRVRGIIDITEAAAGTWATAPSLVQGAGGQALSAMATLGYGQTWQQFGSPARNTGTTYYNTTGRPIFVSMTFGGSSPSNAFLVVNGLTVSSQYVSNNNGWGPVSAIVPPGGSYSLTCTTTPGWFELR